MKQGYGFTIIVSFAAAILFGVGCSNDDSDPVTVGPPNISGQYAVVETLSGSDNCFLDTPIAVPIRIAQSNSQCVLTTGQVAGPEVCGGLSDGVVGTNGVLMTAGATVFTDYWYGGCDLIQRESWTLTTVGSGQFSGVWAIGYRDEPLDCSGAPVGIFPCENSYAVTGSRCDGCFEACPALASGTSRRPGSGWPGR